MDKERANILNNYFASVFTKERDENLLHFEDRYTEPLEGLEITNETVEKSLSSMKAAKSQGPDMIHPRTLRDVCYNARWFWTTIRYGPMATAYLCWTTGNGI